MTPANQRAHPAQPALPILSVAQTRTLEVAADADGITYAEMMERAGTTLAERALAWLVRVENASVLLLVGPGNNGGDGLVAARILRERSVSSVNAYLLRARSDDLTKAAHEWGVRIVHANEDEEQLLLRQHARAATLIIDALYGIGLRLPLPNEAVSLLRVVRSAITETVSAQPTAINPARPAARQTPPHVIAADCPSGLAADTGALDEDALSADETVTFLAPKPGLFTETAATAIGSLTVAPLGIPESLVGAHRGPWQLAQADFARSLLPPRHEFSHKGSNGRLLIVAGNKTYIGAVALATRAAYRSGAGMVQIASPATVRDRLAGQLLEAIWLPLSEQDSLSPDAVSDIATAASAADAILVGPGLGLAAETRAFLVDLLHAKLPPLVLDADALTLLTQLGDWPCRLPARTVLTPHPRELSRLCGLTVADIQANRWEIAARCAREWGVTLLLKGAHSVIAALHQPVTVLPFRLDALATAGTGDVLSGIIGAFLAGGSDATSAAIAGGYLHALAGGIAQGRQGSARAVIASDVITALGAAFAQLDSGSG